jgi:hypothetical protein
MNKISDNKWYLNNYLVFSFFEFENGFERSLTDSIFNFEIKYFSTTNLNKKLMTNNIKNVFIRITCEL